MGLFDILKSLLYGGNIIQCPSCGAAGAKKTKDGRIHCKNFSCPYFDASYRPYASRLTGNFKPLHPVTINYLNFKGEAKTFVAELNTIERKRNHIVGEVAPTGRKISLSRERIQNLREVESQFTQRVATSQAWPTPRERQVLNYHKKHGSSSPLFEKIRAKYPNW